MRNLLLSLFICLLCSGPAHANNVQVTNVRVSDQAPGTPGNYAISITYDLSWENSWRLTSGPSNFDGVYIFARYRQNGGEWKHTGNVVTISVPDFEEIGFAGTGYILYRDPSNTGSGDVSLQDISYRGRIEDLDFDPNAETEVKVFAVEMVWIPEGNFFVGEAQGPENGFYRQLSNGTEPFEITAENNSIATGGVGRLNMSLDNGFAGALPNSISNVYPKGHEAFWMMKYEVSQQQYVDFFNTLTAAQKTVLDPTGLSGKNTDAVASRNGCSWTGGNSDMTTSLPNVAMNFVNQEMMYAYLDWSGLRPMSEFEYVKAARGPVSVVANEYAWGTAEIAMASYQNSNAGTPAEGYTQMSTSAGNAQYLETDDFSGPVRVGAIAASVVTPSREQAGASYYGVMDLSGNVNEMTVSVSAPASYSFRSNSGNFEVEVATANGNIYPTGWPDPSVSGIALRGGGFRSAEQQLRVANRSFGAFQVNTGVSNTGFRGVSSLAQGVE